jgi:hypothetical protein
VMGMKPKETEERLTEGKWGVPVKIQKREIVWRRM